MTTTPPSNEAAAAVLVAVQPPGVSDQQVQSSLDELSRLVVTLGMSPVARLVQRRADTSGATGLGSGKLRELARLTGGDGVVPSGASRRLTGSKPREEPEAEADLDPDEPDDEPETGGPPAIDAAAPKATVVVFDHELAPSQIRNLEAATGAEVHDRTSVILAIFQRHARTREAKLQVELARLSYLAPRWRATGGGDRQRGGIGGKGAGESSLELDRRRVRDRIAELRDELAVVRQESETRRGRREESDAVALVGYTNAGKSSLMRALTGSDVLVADKLFATLDTTVRALHPPSHPRILVTDTVGFIKKLPHDLVASFRSTLEEARHAALLVHVVDAADAAWPGQLQVTREVLGEIGAGDRPSMLVFNKRDRLTPEQQAELAAAHPEALLVSSRDPADVARLRARILELFTSRMEEAELFVTWADQRRAHEIHETCHVLKETHGDDGTRFLVRAAPSTLRRLGDSGASPAKAGS